MRLRATGLAFVLAAWAGLVAVAPLGCRSPNDELLKNPDDGSDPISGGSGSAATDTPDGSMLGTSAIDAMAQGGGAGDSGQRSEAGSGGDGSGGCADGEEFGTCTRPNAFTVCVEGQCLLVECEGEFVDCDGDPENGCEASLESTEHCGLCGARCELDHARARCTQGACELDRCDDGYGDCDGSSANGCETPLDSLNHCGDCEVSCGGVANGFPGCIGGSCGVGRCKEGYGDCDPAEAGCEQLLSDVAHCGGCDSPCAPPAAVGNCDSGQCLIESCSDSSHDCNGLAKDGCEVSFDSAEHCGGCGQRCELPQALVLRCDVSAAPTCMVDHSCPAGASGCEEGAPENGCKEGYADCDGKPQNGCETRLDTLTHCGACNAGCSIENAIAACNAGSCEFVACEPGFDRCGGASCASLADDPENCGDCGNACGGGTPYCSGGRCASVMCPAGSADCNGEPGDGCETALDSVAGCGSCDVSCGPYDNASAACSAGRCELGGCDVGFADCDGVVSNGCEQNIHSLDACGSCVEGCSVPFAEESCDSGSCELVTCDVGRADCDGELATGCETDLSLPGSCGDCDTDCMALSNVLSGGCEAMQCQIVCQAGYGDCDGKAPSGCEASLAATLNCGRCGNDCSLLPHVASASCADGGCGELVCETGYADCNGDPDDGCERAINTLSDCGGCDVPCAPERGGGDCSSGSCVITGCDGGFDDCNADPDDGCESSLSDAASCGSCDNSCASGFGCSNGECVCVDDSACGGLSCCGGQCVDTNSICSWGPCPDSSTERPVLHCGACDIFCPAVLGMLWCCAL